MNAEKQKIGIVRNTKDQAEDPDPHSFSLLDPDPGGKLKKKTEKMQGIWRKFAFNYNFYSKFGPVPWFYYFSQICLSWIRIRTKNAVESGSALRKTTGSGSN